MSWSKIGQKMDFVKFLEAAQKQNEEVYCIWTDGDNTDRPTALGGDVVEVSEEYVYLRRHEIGMIKKYEHIVVAISEIKAIRILSDRESFVVDSC